MITLESSYLKTNKYLQFGVEKCKTMIVSKQRVVDQIFHTELKVYTWKVSYDKEGNLKEIFDGEFILLSVASFI